MVKFTVDDSDCQCQVTSLAHMIHEYVYRLR
jgi:hypothetical protein